MRQVGKTVRGSDRKLRGIVQSRIEEPSYAMHLQRGDKRVPVTHSSPRPGPCMLIEPCETKRIRKQCRSRNVRTRNDTISHLLRIESLAVEYQLRVEFARSPTIKDSTNSRITNTQQICERT